MAVAIWQARALTSSTVSRASYLTDKATALTEYVTFLLSRPTRSRVEEAVAVVRDSRSVALLEEILAATEPAVGKSRALLAQLREELHEAIGGEGPLGTTRRTGSTTPNLATIQRQWIELNRNVRASVNTSVNTGDWPDILLVEARDQQFAIKGRKVHVLNWNRPELEEKLKWLRFELMAPMVDATTNPHVVNSRLDEFSHALWQPISEKTNEVVTICPDGTLWQVPWQVLAASESDSEVVLSVGAWSGRAQGRLPAKPKTMIWHHAAPGLPDIERETSRFLERFPDSVSCSSIIDVRRCLEEGDVDVLHIAAHARFHSTNPMFSSLVFDGGRVTGAEIANSKLRAKHVVLSACETGTVSLQNRTEPEGLVRAFLSRGASCVLASTWALDDRSAYQYMETYYQALMSGVAFAGSARAARSQVRYSNPHPYYWGSFALFGGYTS